MDRMEILGSRAHQHEKARSRARPDPHARRSAWIRKDWSLADDALLLMIRRYTRRKRVCVTGAGASTLARKA